MPKNKYKQQNNILRNIANIVKSGGVSKVLRYSSTQSIKMDVDTLLSTNHIQPMEIDNPVDDLSDNLTNLNV